LGDADGESDTAPSIESVTFIPFGAVEAFDEAIRALRESNFA
jgi:hypothetical protein